MSNSMIDSPTHETMSGYIIDITVSPTIEQELVNIAKQNNLQAKEIVFSMIHAHFEHYDMQVADDITEDGCYVLASTFNEYPYHVITMVCDDDVNSVLVSKKEAKLIYGRLKQHVPGHSTYVNLGWMTLGITGIISHLMTNHNSIDDIEGI